MTILQEQVIQKVCSLSEDNLRFLLDMMERFMKPDAAKKNPVQKRIGIAKGQDLYDDDYDLDELNQEIAEMFGVAE